MNMVAHSIVREREEGTLERLLMTPINFTALFLKKIFPYLLAGVVNIALLVLAMRFVFSAPESKISW